MLTNWWPVSIWYKFLQKSFFQASYWNLILIPMIPIIHTKKPTLNMAKSVPLRKIHTKIIIVKRNLELNDLGFLYYSANACPELSGFIQQVCNFQCMKSPVELKFLKFLLLYHLFSNFFCYITWFAISPD